MEYFITLIKVIVGFSIINVWIFNPMKPSKWRGGDAGTIKEEFTLYGLPDWTVYVIGIFKVGLAVLLLASIKFLQFEQIASFGLAFFLCGSILMHVKVKDPFFKSIPAGSFLILCLLVALLS